MMDQEKIRAVTSDALQGNILQPYANVFCARMFYLRFDNPEAGKKWLNDIQSFISFEGEPKEECYVNVAFTYEGLRFVGASEAELAAAPRAFREGMQPRLQRLLGPEYSAADGQSGYHAVVLVYPPYGDGASHELARLREDLIKAGEETWGRRENPEASSRKIDEQVCRQIDAALKEASKDVAPLVKDVRIKTQDLHLPLVKYGTEGKAYGIEYFGFRDGVGQPDFKNGDNPGDFISKSREPLFQGGTFLVSWQLQQDVPAFWKAMRDESQRLRQNRTDPTPKELAELIVGRRMDGKRLDEPSNNPTPANPDKHAFSRNDEEGKKCPFHSHARRLNPQRESKPEANPRIIRRGMSYLDPTDSGEFSRGLMFLAFVGDIESQFEFIQRNWVQRGDQVGLTTKDRDVIAGIDNRGGQTTLELTIAGKQVALSLPPFVSFKAGHYWYVPSRAALERLARGYHDTLDVLATTDEDKLDLIERWLEVPDQATRFWEYVERKGGLRLTGRNHSYVFAAAANENAEIVESVLGDAGRRFSVEEYDRRMRPTSGRFMLGMDELEHSREWPAVAIVPGSRLGPSDVDVVEETAREASLGFLDVIEKNTQLKRLAEPTAPAEFIPAALVAFVLDKVSQNFFGLPGPSSLSLLAWAGDVTRYHFRVFADETNAKKAEVAGSDYRAHVVQSLADLEGSKNNQKLREVRDTLKDALGQGATDDDIARNLIGIVTGASSALYRLFVDGFDLYARANEGPRRLEWPEVGGPALYKTMIETLLLAKRRGAPDTLYRVAEVDTGLGGIDVKKGDIVSVWLGGAAADKRGADLLFGAGTHKCPGIAMGKAIINGILRGLREASEQHGLRVVRDDPNDRLWELVLPQPGNQRPRP